MAENQSFQMDEHEKKTKTINAISKTHEEYQANDKAKESEGADFETAITATGFGKFNILLILIATPSGWASIFETTTMSYVFPAAQCDLNLSLANKGTLNAITYAGMISSAFVWGFLCDTLGRKKLLIIGFFLDSIFVLMSGLSQNATMLMLAKFLGGFIINGPFAALTTYLAEFHCARHRAGVQMVLGIILSTGSIILPFLAWAILPLNLNFAILGLSLHSWNFYLCVCCLPALLAALGFFFLPESPKFLMTVGRNQEALAVFRRVYQFNTGQPAETYPIGLLVEETEVPNEGSKRGVQVTANRSQRQALQEGCQQMTPLCFPPYISRIVLVCLMQMLIMMSLNSLRLWLPQIFQAINDYEYYNNGTSTDICTMLEVLRPNNATGEADCSVNLNNSSVYINSIIVCFITICAYLPTGAVINTVGKKRLLAFLTFVSGTSASCIYFAQNTATTVTLAAIFTCLASVCINVVLAAVVDLFPTFLRTMTVSLTMMVGRLGAMSGNFLFPMLLNSGCAPPFLFVGLLLISCAFLTLLLQNTDMKALK